MNTANENDRNIVSDYDAKRHNAHENAIVAASVLNRLAGRFGVKPVFTGVRGKMNLPSRGKDFFHRRHCRPASGSGFLSGNCRLAVRESKADFVNQDNENNEFRKKVVQK